MPPVITSKLRTKSMVKRTLKVIQKYSAHRESMVDFSIDITRVGSHIDYK